MENSYLTLLYFLFVTYVLVSTLLFGTKRTELLRKATIVVTTLFLYILSLYIKSPFLFLLPFILVGLVHYFKLFDAKLGILPVIGLLLPDHPFSIVSSAFFFSLTPYLTKEENLYILLGALIIIYFDAVVTLVLNNFNYFLPVSFQVLLFLLSIIVSKQGFKLLKKYLDIVLAAIASLAFLKLSDWYALALVIALIYVYSREKFDERWPIIFSIIYLILAAIFLAKGEEKVANQLAIVTYWNLVVGVFAAFIKTLKEDEEAAQE